MFTNFHLSGRAAEPGCIRDEQTEAAAAAAHSSGHEFIHAEKNPSTKRVPRLTPPLCLPREQTFMKTFPQNHYNSITIPSSRYLRHDCICCSANPPTQTPQHLQRRRHHHRHHFLYTADVTKQGGRARRLHFLWDVCGEALSSSTFYTCSSHSQCVSIHHPLWGERERGSSRQTCSYATAICRGKRMNC